MTRKTVMTVALFILPILLFSARVDSLTGDKTSGSKTQVDWKTFDQGMDLAKQEKKLLVIDFYTDWCHWCKVMDKDTYGDASVQAYVKDRAIMAKINAETDEKFRFKDGRYSGRELAMMFGVRGFPTTAFLTAEGELITAISGFIPADRFALILKYLAEDWYQKMKFDEFQKAQSQDDKS